MRGETVMSLNARHPSLVDPSRRMSTFPSQVTAFTIFTPKKYGSTFHASNFACIAASTFVPFVRFVVNFVPPITAPSFPKMFTFPSQLPAITNSNHLPPAPHEYPGKSSLQRNTLDWHFPFGFWSVSSEFIDVPSWFSFPAKLRDFHAPETAQFAFCNLHFAFTKPAWYRAFLHRTAKLNFSFSVNIRANLSQHAGHAETHTLAPSAQQIAFALSLFNSSARMTKRFYITTAIDYVNGQPHLGHAYEKVISDVIARVETALGRQPFFLTGLDEHGQKVQQAAHTEGKNPQQYCDDLSLDWKRFAAGLKLSNNDFVRTSEERHKTVVQAILTRLNAAGHFYKAEYKGFYSTRQETFLTEKDRQPDGKFDAIYGEVVELVEQNYYFKLKEHQPWLIDYIEKNPDFVAPSYRRNEVLGFLKNNELEDLCITRPAARLNWGIPIPFDPAYVTYVWFDALVNYVTIPAAYGDPEVVKALGLEKSSLAAQPSFQQKHPLWPADLHVIGKDILKFHAVYWPIMLKAMGLPLPKQLLVHGFWQKDGEKISKTTGNIIDPVAVIQEWGIDAFRYYVTRELDIGPDGNWTDAGFAARYGAELANGLGNLLNRSLSMLNRYREGIVPAVSNELQPDATEFIRKTRAHYEQHEIQDALTSTWGLITRANQYVDQTAPFKIAKDPAQAARLDEVLYNLAEVCRIIAILVAPVLPDTSAKILEQLNLGSSPQTLATLAWGALTPGHRIGQPAPLFPRKDLPPK
jgi:methionyl-tRNA synthetase